MESYDAFQKLVDKAASRFGSWNVKGPVRVISHLDADGISACALTSKFLSLENINYSISIVPQLDIKTLKEISEESYNTFIFTDLGSGQIGDIKGLFSGRKVVILDHHELVDETDNDDLILVNPHLVGIDGGKEISGSGVVYFFTKALNKGMEKSSHIALVGAIGDIQEDNGFLPLNSQILDDAISNNLIEVQQGLRFFGLQSKPLCKVLTYCKEIPGVDGESSAVQFMLENNISPKSENRWRRLMDLSDSERQRLVASIIVKRSELDDPEAIIGNVYYFCNEKISELKDVKEFSTVMNACGRMDKVSFGIGACLGDERSKRKTLQVLAQYKSEIVTALNWFRDNKDSEHVTRKPGFVIINAKRFILDTVVGTMASILSKSGEFEPGTYVMSLARKENEKTKVSLRYAGEDDEVNLREVVNNLVSSVGGEAGGHAFAAGAIIPTEVEEKFIESANSILSKLSLEEKVH